MIVFVTVASVQKWIWTNRLLFKVICRRTFPLAQVCVYLLPAHVSHCHSEFSLQDLSFHAELTLHSLPAPKASEEEQWQRFKQQMEEVTGPPASSTELTLSVADRLSLCCFCIIYLHMLSHKCIMHIYMQLISLQKQETKVRTFNKIAQKLLCIFPSVPVLACSVTTQHCFFLFVCLFIFFLSVNLLETSGHI